MILFHYSPVANLRAIDPKRSKGARQVVWLCDERRREWAFHHVKRHQKAKRLYCYLVIVHDWFLTRQREGVYLSHEPIFVHGAFLEPLGNEYIRVAKFRE